MVGIELPFSKMSLVVVLTGVAVALAGLVPVVNGCRIRLAAAEVVLVDKLIGAVAVAGLVPVVNGCRLRLAGAVVVLVDRLIGAVVVLFGRLIDCNG